MKKISQNITKLILVIIFLLTVISFVSNIATAQSNQINQGINHEGYMWTSTVGWISLSSQNNNSPTSYGLTRNPDSTFTGYGWSENIGWISFRPEDTTNCPVSDSQYGCKARINGNNVEGWARACSVFASGCSGSLKPTSQTGGWDGWISLGKQSGQSGPNYGPTKNADDLYQGYSWGSTIVGWVDWKFLSAGNAGEPVCGYQDPVQSFETAPNSDCQIGIPSPAVATLNGNNWTWTCTNNSIEKTCTAPKATGANGICNNSTVNGCVSPSTPTNQSNSGSTYTWQCQGANGGGTSGQCHWCAAGSSWNGSSCVAQNNPTTVCVPIITVNQSRTITNSPSGSCPLTWSVTHANQSECKTAVTNCTLDGSISNSPTNINIGQHVLRCTSTINGISRSTQYSPNPICRLNPNYGEF